jgi:Kinetochore complex Sim4 subunit Fta1
MPERFLHRTWIIRTVSPFTVAWDVHDLRAIESSGTQFLRRLIETPERISRDGTYVTMEWITLHEASSHLLLDVRIADESSASIVLCLAKSSSPKNYMGQPSTIDSFPFCMVHGERKIYEIILRYVEKATGCVVGNKSFRPGSIHLARTLIDIMAFMDDTTSGQVDITFGMPRNVKCLDEFSLSIPRTSFERFLIGLDFNRPRERREVVPLQDDLTIHFFKAIRLFVLEIMRMDIDLFPIIRVANSILSIGGTGKLKILDRSNIHNALTYIEKIMMTQISTESVRAGTKRKRIPSKKSSGGAGHLSEYSSDEDHDENVERPQSDSMQEQNENTLPFVPVITDYTGVELLEI